MHVAEPLPKLNLSAAVLQAVGPSASAEVRQKAARGELNLAALDFLAALLVLCSGTDAGLKRDAVLTLRRISSDKLVKLLQHPELHPRLIDFLVRGRVADLAIVEAALAHARTMPSTVSYLARLENRELAEVLVQSRWTSAGDIFELLRRNPAATGLLASADEVAENEPEELEALEDVEGEESESAEVEEVEEENLSKYQLALEMGVAEKIKMALTGDKEWRSLLYKDSNKLVNSAVLKNPRISEGEVLGIAKNRAASDEHIRIITLNRNWMKNPEVQKALVVHPRTPLPKALRYMNVLTVKELKNVAKSKGVSQVISNNARRLLMQKEQKS